MLKLALIKYQVDVESRQITNRELSKILNVSEAHISRMLKMMGIKRPPPEYIAKRLLAEARREYRRKLARTLTPAQAAVQANCTERTIYRYRNT